MGYSITDFRGVGFTAKDWKLQVWLHLLAREADRIPNPPDWLCAARDHWREQATLTVNDCIDTGLDKFLTDKERVVVMQNLAQRVYSSLVQFGEYIHCDYLNHLCQSSEHSR